MGIGMVPITTTPEALGGETTPPDGGSTGISVVKYDTGRLEPAPFISITKNYDRTQDGTKLGSNYTIRIVGEILSYMGSPDSDGDITSGTTSHVGSETVQINARLASMSRKIEALKKLFSTDGKKFYWQSADGSQECYCYPEVISIEVPEGQWVTTAPYTITLEADTLYGLTSLNDDRFAEYISNATESWDLSPQQPNSTFTIRHGLNAVGKAHYIDGIIPTGAYEYARLWVQSRAGFDDPLVSGSLLQGDYAFHTFLPYNHVREESIDELGGSYSLTETWILSSGSYIDEYTASESINPENLATKSISIQGSVRGFYSGLNNQWQGYNNALSGWNVVKTELSSRANSYISNVNFSNGNVDYDRVEGAINYNYTYDNSPFTGYSEEYTVSRSIDAYNYKVVVGVEGTIQGKINPEESYSIRYDRALSGWLQTQPNLFSRAQQYASGVATLKTTPLTRRVSDGPIQGTINYSYEFDNRENDTYDEDFGITSNYDRDQGITTITVNGSIRGLSSETSGNVDVRYMNASGAFSDLDIYARAQEYAGISFSNQIIGKEIVHQPLQGTISYSYVYNNEPANLFPDAISEVINITDMNEVSIIPIIPIIGSRPVLQNIGSTTEKRRQIGIELVFEPPTGIASYLSAYNTKPDTSSILTALKPTGTTYLISDVENYTIKTRRYTRNAEYIY